jgi:DNA polymerase-3 subunit delta
MTPSELNRILESRKIPPLLFFFGEESYSLEQAVKRIRDILVPPDARDFNYQVFYGKESQATEILDSARTLPVFSPHRMILVKEAHQFPASELEILLPYLKEPIPETTLLFTAEKVDSRRKFFQEFKKRGALVEFKRFYENQIPGFIRQQAAEDGRSFTEDALALFSRRVGTNLQEVHAELRKLFDYLGERDLVDVADVAEVVSDTRADSIFELTDALGRRHISRALRLLGRLLDEGVAPLVILSMMTRHFRQLWKIRELLDQGASPRELPRRVGVNPYFIDGLIAQARHYPPGRYRMIFERFLEVDLALKSSGAHPAALLEALILDVAGEMRRG